MNQEKKIRNNEKNGQTPFINLLSSAELDRYIKNLSTPSFLGSVHLKKNSYQNISSVDDLSQRDGKLNMTDSIKNVVFNPITKILLVSAVLFNIFWFVLKIFMF